MVIFPAIDLLGGRCVRLVQGDYDRSTVYDDNPLAPAKTFVAEGAAWLHVVDLDGARSGTPVNTEVIRAIVAETGARVQVGGGVRSLEHAQRLLDCGVERVIVGSALVRGTIPPEAWFDALGDRLVAGLDARNGEVAIEGWLEGTGLGVVAFAQELAARGAKRVIYTDIAVDGSLAGPSLASTRALAEALAIPVIASGGVSCLDDLRRLAALGVEGAIVGKALYEGRFTLAEALADQTIVQPR
ncbi:MAG: 1-(5-phosphoribosyl)-5-[(5-phosphoribosylamino)methylideneamino]imidazole-4-carboxamide isomerase [Fimbriimonadaceae bacterium]|nr:1-(5-phosphoribosyl)-5-[(5-phosphoribosylamino)methylideneamino]imidazole-4-carboxamide isomerase [Fimbriimonadaceae bacterium]